MAGKAINEYNTFSGNASAVNVLVQEKSQTDPNTYEHKKASLDTLVNTMKGIPSGLASLDPEGKIPESQMPDLSAYATKAELNADVATLQSQIDRNKAEIENLKQTTKQDEQTVQYPDDGNYSSIMPNGVPARVAKYGEVAGIRGKSRGWNQLAKAMNSSGWYETGGNASFSDGVATLTPSYQYARLNCKIAYIANHKMLVSADIKLSNATNADDVSATIYGVDNVVDGNRFCSPTTNWQTLTHIAYSASTSPDENRLLVSDARTSDWGTIQVKNYICHDLTLIFGAGNEPATVADALAQLPALGQYNAYDAGSLVDTTVTGAESRTANKVDSDLLVSASASTTKSGDVYSCSNAYNLYAYTADNKVLASDFKENTQYTISWKGTCGNAGNIGWVFKYTDGTTSGRVAVVNSTSETYASATSSSGKTIAFIYFDYGSGSTFSFHELMVNEGTTALPYSPYGTLATISLSAPVTLKSAGAVSEVLDVQTGKKTRPIGSYTFTGNDNWQSYSDGYILEINDLKIISADNPPNIICAGYATANIYSSSNMIIAQLNWDKYVFIRNSSFASVADCQTGMAGKTINYELATPLSDEQVCDPIIDNFLEVEGGGTINTIQSQSPAIDNCLDVTYDFIPA